MIDTTDAINNIIQNIKTFNNINQQNTSELEYKIYKLENENKIIKKHFKNMIEELDKGGFI